MLFGFFRWRGVRDLMRGASPKLHSEAGALRCGPGFRIGTLAHDLYVELMRQGVPSHEARRRAADVFDEEWTPREPK
jgi:hypothetical protein